MNLKNFKLIKLNLNLNLIYDLNYLNSDNHNDIIYSIIDDHIEIYDEFDYQSLNELNEMNGMNDYEYR